MKKYLFLVLIIFSVFTLQSQEKKYKQTEIEDSGCFDMQPIPFSIIKKFPSFKHPYTQSKKEFHRLMKLYVKTNFDFNITHNLNLSKGNKKISIQFIIDKNGFIKNVKVRAPHRVLEVEVIKIIKKLPKFYPGKIRNKFTDVRYYMSFDFYNE